jgi:hypothetical protein
MLVPFGCPVRSNLRPDGRNLTPLRIVAESANWPRQYLSCSAGVTHSWCHIQPTITKLCMYSLPGIVVYACNALFSVKSGA